MKLKLVVLSAATLVCCLIATGQDVAKTKSQFLSPTIDLGCVVSDIDASMKFYTEALGFQEAGAFSVPAGFATESGLTDNKKLEVQILSLGKKGEGSTGLKLMQVEGNSAKADNEFINSTLGFSYLTIMVSSTDDALARLKKAGVKPIAKGPVTLPDSLNPSLALTIVRDPDGNLIELVGPKPTK
jgi:catechol 2,3-dioxygenase-like lactoylglutathione lyase family enzyme